MKIVDILNAKQTLSYEIFPPKGEMPLFEAAGVSEGLAQAHPDWISVTFSAGGTGNSENTFKIANALQEDLGVNALAHLTCMGATVDDMRGHVEALQSN
ncbi:MAG: methylenetetrahydrofolate reductase, partial [Atopobiaceae bacterium]|nr:methylenetetrahydrofolate reductase [Atopobiaceae bacterium]